VREFSFNFVGIMALPELIEIVPLDKPVRAEITVPGSKSITNRALILAALADGETTLRGALWSEDTQIMVKALKKLDFKVTVFPDPNELSNKIIIVNGAGGKIPRKGGTEKKPLRLNVGNAGTAARFLAAFVCLGRGVYELEGVSRMRERPQAGLFNALRKSRIPSWLSFLSPSQQLGYRIDSTNGKLPVKIYGEGPKPGKCTVSIKESSQFASALKLCEKTAGWEIKVTGENAEESPYVAMTEQLRDSFPLKRQTINRKFNFTIEPDASSGSYFWAASWLFTDPAMQPMPNGIGHFFRIRYWPESNLQIDAEFPKFLPLPKFISRQHDLGDSIMTAIVLAPFANESIKFTDLGRLRLQETERVKALKDELTKCGAKVVEEGDTLTVWPSPLHGAEIETYNDHRMAMCFAILGLKVPGIKIKNPACVKKTFPNFFQKLAAQPPHGLGAEILDARSGRKLELNELFAD
jgi:3-phosphoshikimate 1-carboxyvinyltransferase